MPDVRQVPGAWRAGDAILLAEAGPAALAGSEYQARYGALGGRPAELDFAAEAALVRFLWRAAPRCTLVHDCSDGGLAVALAEAAIHSDLGAELDLPEEPVTLFGEGGGRAIVALPRAAADGLAAAEGVQLRRIGTVKGDTLLGVEVGELRRAWDGSAVCGVFGIRSDERDVARVAYFGLFALQHRGQESAGIAVSDRGRLTVLRDMGLVTQVFREEHLAALPGQAAVGHTRYSTTGSSQWENAQPVVHEGAARQVALGHNGNLVNAEELRGELRAEGVRLGSTSDTEVIAALIARDPAPLPEAVANTMRRLEGAYSVTALAEGTVVAFRDRHGFRPLALGRLGEDWVLASETCALDLVGAEWVREVRPGELVWVDAEGLHAAQALPEGRGALCIFEHVYFARPDSTLAGTEVHEARVRMGERLAAEAPADADLVMPIPDSGTPAAIGFSKASGIRFAEGLIKNRYVGRTFIQPDQAMREQGVKMKYNPLADISGKRLVVVEDSIVRGTTTRQIVSMLFEAGAREVHMRVASPPIVSPCFYGIDFGDARQLVAADRSVEQIRDHIGATSLSYLSVEGMQAATRLPEGSVCRACFTRDYPTRVPEQRNLAKLRFEPAARA